MNIPISQIRLDGGTQSRETCRQLVIDEYAESMVAGDQFPPVDVFYDGEHYWLVDGFHRVEAAKLIGTDTIAVSVHNGTQRDAILYSVGVNSAHGLQRTNADKRKAVMTLLHDPEWQQWSDREIARRCGVGHATVSNWRNALSVQIGQIEDRKAARNGKTYTQKKRSKKSSTTAGTTVDAAASLTPEVRQAVAGTDIADNRDELDKLASLPPEKQEEVVDKIASGEATTVNQALRQQRREDIKVVTLQEALSGKYPVIYADPPWSYSNSGFNTSAERQYPTMPLEDICAMPVSDYATENAVLFMWATNPLLEDAFKVIRAWGFTYKTNICWDKEAAISSNMAQYVLGQHELLLIATRGSMIPETANRVPSIYRERRREHSRKPDRFYELIESMYPGMRYVELFARQTKAGWDCFGNEIEKWAA